MIEKMKMLKHLPYLSFLINIIRINPFVYIFEGFRNAMAGESGKYLTPMYAAYFWVVVIVLFLIGFSVQKKAVKFLPDML